MNSELVYLLLTAVLTGSRKQPVLGAGAEKNAVTGEVDDQLRVDAGLDEGHPGDDRVRYATSSAGRGAETRPLRSACHQFSSAPRTITFAIR